MNVWVCPKLDDVSLDMPDAGGVSTSALANVIVWVWLDTREDVNVCEVLDFEGPVGELELEQPYTAIRAMLAIAPSNLTCLAVIWLSFRLVPILRPF